MKKPKPVVRVPPKPGDKKVEIAAMRAGLAQPKKGEGRVRK